jgi:hypothetical protein
MAKRHDAKIVVIHAIPPIPASITYYFGNAGDRISEKIKGKEQDIYVEEIKKHFQEFCKKVET